MATDLRSPSGASITALIRDIINDAQDLIQQQLSLFRQEIRQDFRKTRDAAIMIGAGVGVTAMGVLLILLMLPLLLNVCWWQANAQLLRGILPDFTFGATVELWLEVRLIRLLMSVFVAPKPIEGELSSRR